MEYPGSALKNETYADSSHKRPNGLAWLPLVYRLAFLIRGQMEEK